MNPQRPHDFQISDSRFVVRGSGDRWAVVESWWYLDRHNEKDQREEEVAVLATEAEANAERDRRASA